MLFIFNHLMLAVRRNGVKETRPTIFESDKETRSIIFEAGKETRSSMIFEGDQEIRSIIFEGHTSYRAPFCAPGLTALARPAGYVVRVSCPHEAGGIS